MDNSAEYWRRAQAAREQARLASDEKSKATWLRIAESFETLFRLSQREEEALGKKLSIQLPTQAGLFIEQAAASVGGLSHFVAWLRRIIRRSRRPAKLAFYLFYHR